jgi:hypothetical protein
MSDDTTSTDFMNYNEIVEKALKGVVRESLNRAAATGLPGEHHFYISFATTFPDVELPDHLRERYPEEITIVLQHEFWDLDINDDGFSVTLSFNNNREFIGVPWAAITGFADPSVQFGLQFKTVDEADYDLADSIAEQSVNSRIDGLEAETNIDGDDSGESAKPVSADVVELDQFRKK